MRWWDITTHNPTLLVRLKVEPFEQWNPGPSFKTYQPQRAKLAARNSGTNSAVYSFSRFQLTIRQIRGIRCIGQLKIVESAACSGFRGSDSGIRNSANKSDDKMLSANEECYDLSSCRFL